MAGATLGQALRPDERRGSVTALTVGSTQLMYRQTMATIIRGVIRSAAGAIGLATILVACQDPNDPVCTAEPALGLM